MWKKFKSSNLNNSNKKFKKFQRLRLTLIISPKFQLIKSNFTFDVQINKIYQFQFDETVPNFAEQVE